MALRLRRGTTAELAAITPALGELIYVTDTKSLYVGDGTTQGGKFLTAGSALIDDLDLNGNDIVGTGNIDITGNITASGTIVAQGNITIGNEDTDSLILNAEVDSNIVPNTNETFDLGTSIKRWNTAHVNVVEATTVNADSFVGDVTGLHIGDVYDQSSAAMILNGQIVGPVVSNVTGNLTGNVIASDLTTIVNATTKAVTGTFSGNLTGDVTGDILGNVKDSNGINVVEIDSPFLGGGETLFQGVFNGDLRGSVTGDDSTKLIDQTESSINLNGTIKGPVTPNADNTVSLGETNFRFRNIYLSDKVHLGTYDNVNVRVEEVSSLDRAVVKGGVYSRLPLATTLSSNILAGSRTTFAVASDVGIEAGAIFRLPGTGELVVDSVAGNVVTATTSFEVSAGETGTLSGDTVVFYNMPKFATHYALAAPAAATGSPGDVPGLIFADSSYIYVCRGTYDGATEIWSRSAHVAW